MTAEVEYGPKARADKKGVDHVAKDAEGKGVINGILHKHAAVLFYETVLVMPESVRAEALFIHEEIRLPHMRYFRNPRHREARQRADCIGYDLSRIHRLRFAAGDAEIKPRWSDAAEVGWVCEVFPCLIHTDGQRLRAGKSMKHAESIARIFAERSWKRRTVDCADDDFAFRASADAPQMGTLTTFKLFEPELSYLDRTQPEME